MEQIVAFNTLPNTVEVLSEEAVVEEAEEVVVEEEVQHKRNAATARVQNT